MWFVYYIVCLSPKVRSSSITKYLAPFSLYYPLPAHNFSLYLCFATFHTLLSRLMFFCLFPYFLSLLCHIIYHIVFFLVLFLLISFCFSLLAAKELALDTSGMELNSGWCLVHGKHLMVICRNINKTHGNFSW